MRLLIIFLILGGFLWLFSIWAGATLAQNKGRSPVAGALLGAFLGLLGLLIMANIPDNKEARRLRERGWRGEYEGWTPPRKRLANPGDSEITAATCPECGRENREDWTLAGGVGRRCVYCGALIAR